MLERVKAWRSAGREVRIMTARASDLTPAAKRTIETWCEKHVGEKLPITNEKDPGMVALWDDRAVAVERNRGYSKKAAWISAILDRNGDEYRVDEAQNLQERHLRVVDRDNATISEVKVKALAGDRFPEGSHGIYYWHTDPAYRGMGLGTRLLDLVVDRWGSVPLFLDVLPFDKVGDSGHMDYHNPMEEDILRKRYRRKGFTSYG